MSDTTVSGVRIVRIRPVTAQLGLGYRVRMWRVTDPRERRRVGPRDFISRTAAARWITEQGWRYIGHQEVAG